MITDIAPIRTNTEADGELLEAVATPDDDGQSCSWMPPTASGSPPAATTGSCVAWTIADLDGADSVRRIHIAEALSYRRIAPGRG